MSQCVPLRFLEFREENDVPGRPAVKRVTDQEHEILLDPVLRSIRVRWLDQRACWYDDRGMAKYGNAPVQEYPFELVRRYHRVSELPVDKAPAERKSKPPKVDV